MRSGTTTRHPAFAKRLANWAFAGNSSDTPAIISGVQSASGRATRKAQGAPSKEAESAALRHDVPEPAAHFRRQGRMISSVPDGGARRRDSLERNEYNTGSHDTVRFRYERRKPGVATESLKSAASGSLQAREKRRRRGSGLSIDGCGGVFLPASPARQNHP